MVEKSELEIVRKEIIGLYKRKFTTIEIVNNLKHQGCGCKSGDEVPLKRPVRKRVVCTKIHKGQLKGPKKIHKGHL